MLRELTERDERIVRSGRCPNCDGILFDRSYGIKQCKECGDQYDLHPEKGVLRIGGIGE